MIGERTPPPATLWLTGLPAAGKSTLAHAIRQAATARGRFALTLDGDDLRSGLSADLSLSPDDRSEQARRAAHVAAIVQQAGGIAVVALVSPYTADRAMAREVHARRNLRFLEVWVQTPPEVCEARDPKGLYARARSGELTGLTGIDAPYEAPGPDALAADGTGEPAEEALRVLAALIDPRRRP